VARRARSGLGVEGAEVAWGCQGGATERPTDDLRPIRYSNSAPSNFRMLPRFRVTTYQTLPLRSSSSGFEVERGMGSGFGGAGWVWELGNTVRVLLMR